MSFSKEQPCCHLYSQSGKFFNIDYIDYCISMYIARPVFISVSPPQAMWFIIYTVVYMKSLEAGLAWWHPWITPLSATLNINTRHIRFEIEPFDASKDAVLVFESLWWQVVKYFPWSSNLRGFEFCKISLHLKYVELFEQGGRSFKCIETKDSRLKQISSETFSLIFRPYHSLVYIFLLPCFDDCGQAVDLLTFCV